MRNMCTVLTIAGSDSSAGAGIQADIKSITANGGYAASVITATTAQNTLGVNDIHAIPVSHIIAQMEAVFSDIHIDAVKIGMLHSTEVIDAVERTLTKYSPRYIVLDPVMVSTSGEKLINEDALERLKRFMSSVSLITPNIPEASILIDRKIDQQNMISAAKELAAIYGVSVLLKGGHLSQSDMMYDVLYNRYTGKSMMVENPRIETANLHGTGCSLASAVATYLAQGKQMDEAVLQGCTYLHKAIDAAKEMRIGKGNGPIDHFFILR